MFQEDWVLHMECVWEVVGGAGDVQDGVGNIRSGASNVQGGAGPLLVRSLASPTSFGARSLPVRHLPDASAQIGRPSASKSVLKNLLQFNIVHMCSECARNAWHKARCYACRRSYARVHHNCSGAIPYWDPGASAVSSVGPYSPHYCSSLYNNPRDSVGLSMT
jgi:hypothetical protein